MTKRSLATRLTRCQVVALLAVLVTGIPAAPAGARAGGAVQLFPVASPVTFSPRDFPDDVSSLVVGPDGNLWFTESNPGHAGIGRITPSGALSSFLLAQPTLSADSVAAGNDGTLWFTSSYLAHPSDPEPILQRMTTAGVVLPTPGLADDNPVTLGPDGNIWTAGGFNGIASIAEITSAGVTQQLPLPTEWGASGPIVTGPDGALWFTAQDPFDNQFIASMTLSGAFNSYQVPGTPSAVTGITAGPDGAVWFSENDGDTGRIGRITPGGQMTVFKLPIDPLSGSPLLPNSIARGPDGAVWFTASVLTAGVVPGGTGPGGDIGRITTSGQVSLYYPPDDLAPASIVTGPDGDVWIGFTGAIGRLTPSAAPGQLTAASAPPSQPQPKKHHRPRRRHHRHRHRHGRK